MDASLTDLTAALRERLAIIGDEESRADPDRHTERLRDVSEKIERLEQSLPPEIDPELRHFLQRRSYSKALELLESPTANTTRRSTAR
jgi:phytoene dehydrogenase-like protein